MAQREWVRIVHPKIKSAATVAKSALPQMKEQGWREDKPESQDKLAGQVGPTEKKEK